MISLLSRWFIRDRDNVTDAAVRRAWGALCGFAGIGFNLILFATKLFAGSVSGSIAITADAFNNLSDAGSSVVTLLGFRLAGKKPDTGHPFGHGRLEYISGLVVAGLILLMGVELGKTSFDKILHPAPVDFSWLAAGILVLSILVKLYMNYYNRAVGKRIQSAAMSATATDSLSDAVSTTAVLLSMLLSKFTGVAMDGWAGMLVALFILYSAGRAAIDTISPLLGQPPAPEFVREIESIVMAHPLILGIHDLVVHDYGPGRLIISLHAEVPSNENVLTLHDIIDNAEQHLAEALHCEAVIHMDPIVVDDDGLTSSLHAKVAELVKDVDPRITIHDFRVVPGPSHTNLIFDAVIPFDEKLPPEAVGRRIREKVTELEGNYLAVVKVENAYTTL